MPADLFLPAARQEADQELALPRQAVARRRPLEGGQHVEERVADELDGHPRLLVQADLEREDGEDPGDVAGHRPQAPAAPGPDLRRHEIDDRDAEPARPAGQQQVEVGEVDQDQDARPRVAEPADEIAEDAVERREAADDLGAAHDGRALDAVEDLHAGRRHARPAHAGHGQLRLECRERAGERGAVKIAGGLSGDHQDVNRPGVPRGFRQR